MVDFREINSEYSNYLSTILILISLMATEIFP